MESGWAAEHLQVIRTLMERSAIYRRALAPVMTAAGALGTVAAAAGLWAGFDAPRPFIAFWMSVALVAIAASFLLVRRQALKAAEPFWSPPTRRVAQALLVPLFFGFILGMWWWLRGGSGDPGRVAAAQDSLVWLPPLWVGVYGCALHAAGFFMPRGMKYFGCAFVVGGAALFLFPAPVLATGLTARFLIHGTMGLFFGIAHLAYGVYLYFTEPRGNEP